MKPTKILLLVTLATATFWQPTVQKASAQTDPQNHEVCFFYTGNGGFHQGNRICREVESRSLIGGGECQAVTYSYILIDNNGKPHRITFRTVGNC